MNLHTRARTLVKQVAMLVAKDRRSAAERAVRGAFSKVQKEAEPRLEELETDVATLRKALAFHYTPTPDEIDWWVKHCDRVWSAGGTPPSEVEWRADLALSHLEFSE